MKNKSNNGIEDMVEKIKSIELPILIEDSKPPRQLILRKKGELVMAYDPVYDISIKNKKLNIEGYLNNIYKHSLNEFDLIQIINHDTDEVLQEINK